MISFKTYLAEQTQVISEALSAQSLDKASFIITKYLKRKTGLTLFKFPGVEEYTNSSGHGFGMRFMAPKKNYSVRFNWKTQSGQGGLVGIESIDFWNGHEGKPYHIQFDSSVSIIKVLPIIADVLKDGKVAGKVVYTLPDDVPLNESVSVANDYGLINEVSFDPTDMYDGILDLIQDPSFAKGKIYPMYKAAGFKMFDEIERRFPKFIVKQGTKYIWAGKDKDLAAMRKAKDEVLKAIGAETGTVSRGAEKEKYKFNPEVEKIESDQERLSFEAQLADLENLTKLTIAGASSSLFVAGKGGVGKTHSVEKILHQMGMRDGENYFKNAGSASAAGIYMLLFKNKNNVILFDDCDSAFADQEARNVFKAATDTKKVRKLTWSKRGSNVVNPEDFSDDEILANGDIPQYFNFTGKVIVISNLPLNKLDPDGALRTRGYIINIDPTDIEIFDFMEKIVDKMPLEDGLSLDSKSRKHCVDLLRNGNSKQSPNLRQLCRALNMTAGSIAAGVEVSDSELSRMIGSYC